MVAALSHIMPPVFKSELLIECETFLKKHGIISKVLGEAQKNSQMLQHKETKLRRIWGEKKKGW